MRVLESYSHIKGFNHEPNFNTYTQEIMEKELGYAKRLGLNSCRLFMPMHYWQEDKEGFLKKLQAFVRTAYDKYGITTTPILLMAYFTEGQSPYWISDNEEPEIPGCYYEENYHIGEEFVTATVTLLKDEPGLLFWDLQNEPSYHGFVINIKDEVEKQRRMDMVWRFVHHFLAFVRKLDPVNAIGIGHTLIEDTEYSKTGELVDIIIFHDYLETRARVEASCKRALELSKKYNKPVLNNEMACLCRANPYDVSIEIHDKYNIGWYIFKLMIDINHWGTVHGICYPDGTVRDPSIVAAVFGFFRNRGVGGDDIIYPEINREGFADKGIARVKEALDKKVPMAELLEAAEVIVNLLEAGELVPMAYPPSAKLLAYRGQENPNEQEIREWAYSLVKTLQDVCQII